MVFTVVKRTLELHDKIFEGKTSRIAECSYMADSRTEAPCVRLRRGGDKHQA